MEVLSGKYGFSVDRVDEFKENGDHVSSSAIRRLLESGNVSLAGRYLGRNYSLSGKVVEGSKLGRELGVPTANIEPDSQFKLIPAKGVYAVVVRFDDKEFGGVMNIGTNPTVTDDISLKLEVNIFDFDEDIYGKTIHVSFVEYLRAEEKFSSLEVLKHQMQIDKNNSRAILETIFNNKITKAKN